MRKLFQPEEKLKKKMMYALAGSEVFVSILLFLSFLKTYNLVGSLILIGIVIVASIGFNFYLWKRLSNEYIMIGATYIEWNGLHIEWDDVTEIRVKREKSIPMFLIIRSNNEYNKIPLRVMGVQATEIVEKITSLGHEIAES